MISSILKNQPLSDKTYYKMGGTAQYFAQPETLAQIQEILLWAQNQMLPCAVLGSGSNSVFADGLFPGVVISMEKLNQWHWQSQSELFVEAGVTNTEISEICAAANRSGASWMYRMPGQIGASVRMNARCYGGETSQIVSQVMTITAQGNLKTYSGSDVFLGYKSTILMGKPEIVVGVQLSFPHTTDARDLITHMHECESDRHSKQHFYLPSCGSTFKNNYDVGKPSGRIFDELGLKGMKKGDAEVSEFHANFIWNTGHATTEDMLTLTASMREKALVSAHADLELEVQPIGLFSNKLYESCAMDRLGPASSADADQKWVGLLYPKNSDQKTHVEIEFPWILLEFPFQEYHQETLIDMPHAIAKVTQLQSLEYAKQNPDLPFLRWQTKTNDSLDKVFPIKVFSNPSCTLEQNAFTDQLWNHSVSEIFFANPKNPAHYLEFEMTPEGQWIALEFEGLRQRTSKNVTPDVSLWQGVFFESLTADLSDQQTNPCYCFGMSFSFNQVKSMVSKNEILIQCALSLGPNRYFLSPFWSQKGKKEKPDFHQPQRYWKVRLL